jgi:hypothetical protein
LCLPKTPSTLPELRLRKGPTSIPRTDPSGIAPSSPTDTRIPLVASLPFFRRSNHTTCENIWNRRQTIGAKVNSPGKRCYNIARATLGRFRHAD